MLDAHHLIVVRGNKLDKVLEKLARLRVGCPLPHLSECHQLHHLCKFVDLPVVDALHYEVVITFATKTLQIRPWQMANVAVLLPAVVNDERQLALLRGG